MGPCRNCRETKFPCACMRNRCVRCGLSVGNVTFSVCDDCWDTKEEPHAQSVLAALHAKETDRG